MNAVVEPSSAKMHPDEWKARPQLAACYRVFDLPGWTEMIYNHITAHSALHEGIAEAHCVMHTHTAAGLAGGLHARPSLAAPRRGARRCSRRPDGH